SDKQTGDIEIFKPAEQAESDDDDDENNDDDDDDDDDDDENNDDENNDDEDDENNDMEYVNKLLSACSCELTVVLSLMTVLCSNDQTELAMAGENLVVVIPALINHIKVWLEHKLTLQVFQNYNDLSDVMMFLALFKTLPK